MCAILRWVRAKKIQDFACSRHEESVGVIMEQEKITCNNVETVREFTYLADGFDMDWMM